MKKTHMQSRVYDILEMFRPQRHIRQRFQASSSRAGAGMLVYRREFTLPSGRYGTIATYFPQTQDLLMYWTFNGRTIPRLVGDTRSDDEKLQARHDVGFIFQYLSDVIDYVVHNFTVSAIRFTTPPQSPTKMFLYDTFANRLAQQYGGSVGKVESTTLFGVFHYTISLP